MLFSLRAGARSWNAVRRAAARADARALAWLAHLSSRSRRVDALLTRVGIAANRSGLWLLVAAGLSVVGGARGRRSAARGLAAIAAASATVNGPMKFVSRRPRPPLNQGPGRSRYGVPGSFSFPSGHSASAAAFTVGVASQWPAAAVPVGAAAGAVAYSRVHTGVHYPSDVLVGLAVGATAAVATGRLFAASEAARTAPATDPGTGLRRAVLLTSAHAGAADQLARARAAAAAAGITIRAEVPVEQRHRVRDLLRADAGNGPPLVVAAGGDGTVGAAADLVADTDAVLGVLPLGTSNDFARSLGIPTDPARAARLLVTGKISTIDAGRLSTGDGQRHFVHAATAGLNVHFARRATQTATRLRFGRLTYAVAAVQTLRERHDFACTLVVDGQEHALRLVNLSVINAPVFGGALELRVAGADLDDRVLDVLAVEHQSRSRLIAAGAVMLTRPRRPVRGIHVLQGRVVEVRTSEPVDVTLDGEVVGTLPGTFELAAEALRVVTPRDFNDIDDAPTAT